MQQLSILHLEAAGCFALAVFFDAARCEDVFAAVFEAAAVCFVFAPAVVRDPFARTWVAGARRTGSLTYSVRRGLIVLDDRWFQRLRSSTETLNRSAIVTSVSPRRVT